MRRLILLVLMLLLPVIAKAQLTTFVPSCSGTNDTAAFSSIITAIGSNAGTIQLPYKTSAARCAVNTLSIPANITLDNDNGSGIKVNTGQTLTVLGPVVNSPTKQLFYNATSGLGTVTFTNNTNVAKFYLQWWGAVGNGVADDTAAVLATIAAQQAAGGEINVPVGSYLLSATGSQQLLFTKSVKLVGVPGWSIFLVKAGSSVPTTTDIVKYKPGTGTYQYPTKKDNRYFVMDGITILSQTAADGPSNSSPPAGTGGRYALVLDSTNVGGYIHNFEIKNCYFGLLNGAFTVNLVSGPDANDDDLFTGTIGPNNILERGITATTLGDTVNVIGNNIRGTGYALDVTFVNGATTFNFCNNNVISDKGLHFGGFGVMLNIEGNVFEPLYGGAGSNGACVDFDGFGGQILTARFAGNRVNAGDSGASLNGLRIDSASTIFIDNNDFATPAGKFAIVTTANANNPVFGFNRYSGAGGSISDSSPTPVYLTRTTVIQTTNFPGHMGVENLYAGTKLEAGTAEAVAASGYRIGVFNAGGAFATFRETGSDVELNVGARTTDGWIGTATNHALVLRSSNLDRAKLSPSGVFNLYKGADVASAASIVPTGNLFHVTGTTNITSVDATGITAGTTITIIFDGALTFTDGSNLKLAGNFVTTADDTITLEYDGTSWYEVARSAN